jgi:hypothetical protein
MRETKTTTADPRQDLRALWGGMAFSLFVTALVWLLGKRLEAVPLLPDTGPAWYYWRLPVPTFWSRLTSWGLYLVHQLGFWYFIYRAQRDKLRYETRLHRWNKLALGWNALFVLIHFAQTHLFYDGLAQDVAVWTSQGSVIVMLVWILLMENRQRGLFWGKKVPFKEQVIQWARKYHGYYFSWAIIYTFWFHPMVSTTGHLAGFFYMFLLILQGSLFFTRIHINRWWKVLQESLVLLHGALVAVMQGNNMWGMFAFGFGGIFVLTQMHGLRLSKAMRWALLGAYLATAVLAYNGLLGLSKIYQITWIPVIEYLGVFILSLLIGLGLRLTGRWKAAQA